MDSRPELTPQQGFEMHLRTLNELVWRVHEAMTRDAVEVSPSVAFAIGQLAGSLAQSLDHTRLVKREMAKQGIV